MLGEAVDPFRKPDFDHFTPKHLRSLAPAQRAAAVIAFGFSFALEEASKKYPEIQNVKKSAATKSKRR